MIGVEGLSRSLEGGKTDGYRSGSAEGSAGLSDSRLARCDALADALNRRLEGQLFEPSEYYDLVGRGARAGEDGATRLGDVITYLESKYELEIG